jgi:hypothetical protein
MKKIILLFLITLLSTGAYPGDKPDTIKRIAVLNFAVSGISGQAGDAARDLLEVHLYQTGSFQLIERNQIREILKEQGLSESGCVDYKCAVKVGQLLSAQSVVLGSINKINSYNVIVKFINVSNGDIEFVDSVSIQNENEIEKAVKTLSALSSDFITGRTGFRKSEQVKGRIKVSRSDYYFRGIIPGWAQYYSGNRTKGHIYTAGFVITGTAAIGAYGYYTYKKKKYDKGSLGTSKSDFDILYNDYQRSVLIGRVTLGAFTLFYLVNWIDVLFISKPKKYLDVNISRFSFSNDISLEVYPRHIDFYRKFSLADGINLGIKYNF